MTQYLLLRLLHFVPVVFMVTIVVFAITMLLPGDPAMAFLGEGNVHDKAAYETIRQELGLDQPVPVQYAIWVGRALRGDLGRSVRTKEPVIDGLLARVPVTLQLAAMSLVISLLIAIPVGIASATRPNSLVDRVGTVLAIGGVAIPNFWLGILLIYFFAVWLHLLPPSGYISPSTDLWLSFKSLLLPSLTLGTSYSAIIMRQMRSALLEVLHQDFIGVARSKGLSESRVVSRHALKNSLIPVVTVIGLQTGRMIGGAVVVETIFALPGMGRVAADSIFFRDFPMLQGVVLLMALSVLIFNFITDIIYAYLDPRIRYS